METIEESNKLIASFMGAEFEDGKYSHESSEYYFVASELEYHFSWDWLMPVVEKIESLGFEFNIGKSEICVTPPIGAGGRYSSPFRYEEHCYETSKISLTYKAAVEFIKWYNQQKH